MAGGALRPVEVPNPAPEWITERIWLEILTLESLEPFKGFAQNFRTHIQDYKQIFDSSEPERLVVQKKINIFALIYFDKCSVFIDYSE